MTKPFLMGAETEYAVSGQRDGNPIDADDVYEMLAEAVKQLRAWVPDQHGYRGLYLENGAWLYLDYGSHPEHATAECFTPRQVTLYDKGPIPRTETYGEYIQVRSGDIHIPKVPATEPLRLVCEHFLASVATGSRPLADGWAGAAVVDVLEAMSQSLKNAGAPVPIPHREH